MGTGRSMKRSVGLSLLVCGLSLTLAMFRTLASPSRSAMAAQPQASGVAVTADSIGGVVTSSKGPEAGVWVIAETTDLGTKFRKIVVTDDQGRYLLPELRKANYKVWVRGYGLVDSQPVQATPGQTLALTAVVAPNARAAAEYYPANYWYALMKIPPKSAFPMKIPPPPAEDKVERFADCRQGLAKCEENPGRETIPGLTQEEVRNGQEVSSQAEFVYNVKRVCEDCHQMGSKATREIEPGLGTFKNSSLAWERRLRSGQTGGRMLGAVDARFGHEPGLAMFADWSDRIAAGELPPAPARPQGIERNIVLSIWDFASDKAFVHDIVASNQWQPTVNAYGPIYGGDLSAG
ncbi:MAG: carboxypeptidase-like regulatory domain-containing protein, partial [Candidatus Acidiferrales bacterium]